MRSTQQQRLDECNAAANSAAARIELLKRFVRDFPENLPAWATYGVALTGLSRFDEAEVALRRAIEKGEPFTVAYSCATLGNLFSHKGDMSLAEEWYRKAIAHDPDDASW